MEQTPTTSLFSLSIDPVTKAHLSETARWARFLAIVGMVFLILMVIFGVIISSVLTSQMGGLGSEYTGGANYFPGFGIGMVLLYVVLAVVWFFPLLFLLRFANNMKTALNGNDQQALNTSFQHLKVCFRYLGIITIIVLALYAIMIVFSIIGVAAFS